jgi:hypothetical protein
MKLNLKAAFQSLLQMGKRGDDGSDDDGPVSIVLLLRESRVTSLERLRLACTNAFREPFSSESSGRYFVVQKVIFTIINAGPHALSFMHYSKPYGEDRSREFLNSMRLPSQRKGWAEHTAWEAIDYVKSRGNLDLEYAVLAKLCAELVNENCTGAWLPKHQMMIPNDGSLATYLQRAGSSCPIYLG